MHNGEGLLSNCVFSEKSQTVQNQQKQILRLKIKTSKLFPPLLNVLRIFLKTNRFTVCPSITAICSETGAPIDMKFRGKMGELCCCVILRRGGCNFFPTECNHVGHQIKGLDWYFSKRIFVLTMDAIRMNAGF